MSKSNIKKRIILDLKVSKHSFQNCVFVNQMLILSNKNNTFQSIFM